MREGSVQARKKAENVPSTAFFSWEMRASRRGGAESMGNGSLGDLRPGEREGQESDNEGAQEREGNG